MSDPIKPTEKTNQSLPAIVKGLSPMLQSAYEEQSKRGPVDLEKLAEADKGIHLLEHGYYAMVPLTCHGSACPMASKCPLFQAGMTFMINRPCPLEQHLMSNWIAKTVQTLKISPDNHTEMSCAAELAKIDIYEMRISNRLAYEDFIKQQVIGVDDQGVPLYREELHVAAQWDDVLSKRKMKIMDALLATRKSAANAGAGMTSDPSTQASNIKRLLDRKTIELKNQSDDLKASSARNVTPPQE